MDDALAVIVAACRDHWQNNLAPALEGHNPEGIHQVRVGLRRMRSALTLFKTHIPATQRSWLNTETKWLANQLGAVRDMDVFLNDLVAPVAKDAPNHRGLAQLVSAVHSARDNAQAAAVAALRGPRARRLSARLEAWVDGRGWLTGGRDMPATDAARFAREVLGKRLRKVRATAAEAEKLTTAERHDLRIAVKKLRYGLEFMNTLLPAKRTGRLNTVLRHLQDSLGHLNDLDVAERTLAAVMNAVPGRTVRGREIKKAGAAVIAWHKEAADKAEPETYRLCHKLAKLPGL